MPGSALFNYILRQGIGPLQAPTSNPALYPFIAIALVITLVVFIRESAKDTIHYFRRSNRVLTSLGFDLAVDTLMLAAQCSLIYLVWLAFTIPYGALPFLSAPAASVYLGPAPLHTVYAFSATFLHMLVSLVALQALGGLWLAALGSNSADSRRAIAAATAVFTVLAIYGWEAAHWPSAFTIPVEIFLVFSLSLALVRVFAPARATSKVALRLQYICIALLDLLGVSIIWIFHNIGMPPDIAGLIISNANPTLYPFAVVAAAISFVTALVNGALAPLWPVKRQNRMQNAAGSIAFTLALQIGLLWLAWWAITTPMADLPFVTIASSISLAGLPLNEVIGLTATAIHAVVFVLAISNLFAAWARGLLRLAANPGPGPLAAVTLSIPVYVLHRMGWPVWVVVLLELTLLAFVISPDLETWTDALLKRLVVGSPLALRRLQRFEGSLARVAYFLLVTFIVLSNGSTIYIVEFFGLFYMLIQLDAVVAELWSVVIAKKTDGPLGVLSPSRWYLTAFVTCVLSLLGAAGLFHAIAPESTASYSLWLEVGSAAVGYMIFKPLITYANHNAGDPPRERSLASSELIERVLTLAQPTSVLASDSQVVSAHFGLTGNAPVRSIAKKDERNKDSEDRERAEDIRRGLRLPSGPLFFILAVSYHYLTIYLHLSTLLSTSLAPLVFGLIALAASLLQVINNQEMDPPRYVSLMLVLIIIVVAGITVLFTVSPLPAALSSAEITSLGFASVLRNESFLANSMYFILRELLFLLTLGQLIYMFRLIETSLTSSHSPRRGAVESAQDHVELGEWLAQRNQRGKAVAQYKEALSIADDDARILRRAGLNLQRLGQYSEALNAYEQAIALDPRNAIYWNDKGVALAALDRFSEAIAAYQHAIDLDGGYALAWDNTGDELTRMGRFSAALTAYQKAVDLARETTDSQDVYLNDVSLAFMNMRRYDEALRAVNLALKIDSKWAYTWRNKADILLNLPGRHKEALKACERSLQLEASSVRGWALYGMALNASKQFEDARNAFEHAVTLDPEPASTWSSRGDALAGIGQFDEALAVYHRVLKESPYDPDTWRSKAKALRALGRTAEALDAERREQRIVAENASMP